VETPDANEEKNIPVLLSSW